MVGYYENEPKINKHEVEAYRWMTLKDVKTDIEKNPHIYTAWFKIIFNQSYQKLKNA